MHLVVNEIPQFAGLMRNDVFFFLSPSFLRMQESLFYSPFFEEKKRGKKLLGAPGGESAIGGSGICCPACIAFCNASPVAAPCSLT